MYDDKLAVLDLYERYRDGEMFLTGAFGGVKIFIHPIQGADPDDRCWRMYYAPRVQGVDKDRARPTRATKQAPTGWQGVRERQRLSQTKLLASIGAGLPFHRDELQEEFQLEGADDD